MTILLMGIISLKMLSSQVGADNFFGPEMRAQDLVSRAHENGDQVEICDEERGESLDSPVSTPETLNAFLWFVGLKLKFYLHVYFQTDEYKLRCRKSWTDFRINAAKMCKISMGRSLDISEKVGAKLVFTDF